MYENVIAVTNRKLCERPFLEQLKRVAALKPGAVLLREKDLPEEAYVVLAGQALEICKSYGVELILHTYAGAAKRLGASAIHFSFADLKKYKAAGGLSGKEGVLKIGCSVHSAQEAREAELLGASYLIAGHIYATDCKKGMAPRGLSFLGEVCKAAAIPVYAIGGIGLENGKIKEVIAQGAAGACLMSEMMKL